MPLDVHRASEDERLAIYRNVHDVWGGGSSVEEHVARRLASVQHQRAEWFAGVLEGRVVASLGCYPLEFSLHGERVPGFAIGAVHTVAERRGQGLAPRLLAEVERQQAAAGRRIAILFSDIGHDYYARLGYHAAPAHTGVIRVDQRTTADEPEGPTVRRCPAATYLEWQRRLMADRPFFIARTTDYAAHLEERVPGRQHFVVEEEAGPTAVFVLVSDPPAESAATSPTGWLIEFTARPGGDLRSAIEGVQTAAAGLGWDEVAGWLPARAAESPGVVVRPREEELTMVKPLDPRLNVDQVALAAADDFLESDHV